MSYIKQSIGVNCDECGELFGIDEQETERPNSDIVETGFSCPHCGHYTLAFLTTHEIRNNQIRQRNLRGWIRRSKSGRNKQEWHDQAQALADINKDLMDELKDGDGEWIR